MEYHNLNKYYNSSWLRNFLIKNNFDVETISKGEKVGFLYAVNKSQILDSCALYKIIQEKRFSETSNN